MKKKQFIDIANFLYAYLNWKAFENNPKSLGEQSDVISQTLKMYEMTPAQVENMFNNVGQIRPNDEAMLNGLILELKVQFVNYLSESIWQELRVDFLGHRRRGVAEKSTYLAYLSSLFQRKYSPGMPGPMESYFKFKVCELRLPLQRSINRIGRADAQQF